MATDVRVEGADGRWVSLQLAEDRYGRPLFGMSVVKPLRQSAFLGEASYAAFDPQTAAVFAQPDLSRGAGKRLQVATDRPDFRRYHYTDCADASVPGQIGPGPKVSSIGKITNMTALTGAFELGSKLYLIGGREIVSYTPSTHAIEEVEDLGSGVSGFSGAAFFQLATETGDQTHTAESSTENLLSSAHRYAQKVQPGVTGYLSRIDIFIVRTGTVTGNVRVAIQAEVAGKPSGVDLVTTERLAADVPVSPGAAIVFNFDPADYYLQLAGEPFWFVVDSTGGTATAYISVCYAATGYANGEAKYSVDSGATYAVWAPSRDLDFNTYYRAATSTAFVGKAQGAKFLTTTDGAAYTADSLYEGKWFCTHGGVIVRDARASSAGAIAWSYDGISWESVAVGDPSIEVVGLYSIPNVLIVCKQNSIWALDLSEDPPIVNLVYTGGRAMTNAVDGCVFKNVAYIPFEGRLMAVEGNFTNGVFDGTVYQSIGPESLDEWDSPFGAGRVVAVAADRFCLYAAMSTTGSYELFKSYDPLQREWHGSIADLGTPTAFNMMYVFDRGGTTSPELIFSTDSDNVGYIILPRTRVPWADSSYEVTTSAAKVYYSTASGLLYVSPKAWLAESVTYHKEVGSGYVEMLYDIEDGNGWQAMDSRLHRTGLVKYRRGLASLLLKRQLRIYAPSATSYPLILASGLTYAVRPAQALQQYNVTFTVEARDGMSGHAIGDLLGISGKTARQRLVEIAVGGGTRRLEDPWGDDYEVLFLDAQPTILERSGGVVAAITVTGVTV